MKTNEFTSVKQAREIAKNNLKYYNKMMDNKMTESPKSLEIIMNRINEINAAYDKQEQEKVASTYAYKAASIDSAINHIKHGRFIVGSFSADLGLSFSETPAVHLDSVSARKECKRLAAMHPGKLFLFVKLSGAEMMPTVQSVSV